MSIKNKEYAFTINALKRPASVKDYDAIGARLMELIMMEPGDDPLHPDMGVGLRTYRFGINNLDKLKKRIEEQIATYLPFYQSVSVSLITTPDHICNIEITIGDMVYIYDSTQVSKPIKLDEL